MEKIQTLGERLNNPLNVIRTDITWLGKLKSNKLPFEQFINLYYGWRCGCLCIIHHYKNGSNTIDKLIESWTDKRRDDVEVYQKYVSRCVGLYRSETFILSTKLLRNISLAMVNMEQGKIIGLNELEKVLTEITFNA